AYAKARTLDWKRRRHAQPKLEQAQLGCGCVRRTLHRWSSRSSRPFLSLDLAVFLLQRAPLFHSFPKLLFDTLIGRLVVAFFSPKVFLNDEVLGVVMRVLVALTVAQTLGPRIARVAEMLWNRQRSPGAHILQGRVNG